MNWTMPQMLAVSKQDPSLKGRWDPYDSLTGRKRASKGESWGGSGVQLFLPFSPQFNFNNPTLLLNPDLLPHDQAASSETLPFLA